MIESGVVGSVASPGSFRKKLSNSTRCRLSSDAATASFSSAAQAAGKSAARAHKNPAANAGILTACFLGITHFLPNPLSGLDTPADSGMGIKKPFVYRVRVRIGQIHAAEFLHARNKNIGLTHFLQGKPVRFPFHFSRKSTLNRCKHQRNRVTHEE